MATASAAAPRRSLVLADLLPGSLVRDLTLVVAAAALVGVAAQITVPVPGTPVPVTGQTFAVLLAGAALGWRRGLAGMALYLAAGAWVPWYAGHRSGLGGPSFGYIIGYVLAGALVGALAARGGDRTPARTVGSMLVGTAVIYAVGVPWLMADLHLGLGRGLALGMRPFLVGDLLKVALAAGLLPGAWALVRRASH